MATPAAAGRHQVKQIKLQAMTPPDINAAAINATSMNFCRGCGKPIHTSAVSCPHCGAMQHVPSAYTDNITPPAKSKVTAGVLALLLGGLGIHKFYTGAWGWGVVYIALCWTYIPALVALVEGIRYLTLSEADFQQKAAQLDGPFAFLW